ncbi:rhodanese-like domain-containing protein [Paenibacillus campi]|uniref:rhodanese-like domain-containing protein n=1 Tax=Paenibacillus campi TaxID=3106031 RepID=UPI002AFE8D30|nr:rhodanese-like domain-containing protein [Paenibacillus sp. SGZ-1014]
MTQSTPRYSAVLRIPAAPPEQALHYWASRLACETDVADVMSDLHKGEPPFRLLDVRDAAAYEQCHIPGAIHLAGKQINLATTADWNREQTIITYCWGPACNGATKAAATLASLGFSVKEMLGGLEYWRLEGGELAGTLKQQAPLHWRMPNPIRSRHADDKTV